MNEPFVFETQHTYVLSVVKEDEVHQLHGAYRLTAVDCDLYYDLSPAETWSSTKSGGVVPCDTSRILWFGTRDTLSYEAKNSGSAPDARLERLRIVPMTEILEEAQR